MLFAAKNEKIWSWPESELKICSSCWYRDWIKMKKTEPSKLSNMLGTPQENGALADAAWVPNFLRKVLFQSLA